MAKEPVVDAVEEVPAVDTTIKTIAHEYNREDLNELRDTVNALVEAVNNLRAK